MKLVSGGRPGGVYTGNGEDLVQEVTFDGD